MTNSHLSLTHASEKILTENKTGREAEKPVFIYASERYRITWQLISYIKSNLVN